jgi:feruloyl esterase
MTLVSFVLGLSVAQANADTLCEKLTQMTIPKVTIRSAILARSAPGVDQLPPFCRVEVIANPVPDSSIEFEVWIPEAWNGKLQGFGNGGYSGALAYSGMARALKAGYATASHNTGHSGDSMKFGQGHPEKVVDYAYRAVHVMTENAKLIVRAGTGRSASHSYFVSCSAGGHQALSEVQRYPNDYDGVVAGAPANNRIRQTFGFQWSWRALHREDGAPIVSLSKLALVTKAVIESCDGKDGLKDGLIEDPRRCAEPDLSEVLSADEATAVRKVWRGATGIFPGLPMGSENTGRQSWKDLLDAPEPPRSDLFRFFLFHDPNWNWRSLDWERDLAYADAKLGFLDAVNPNLDAFRRRGGKLLMYAGWGDHTVPPEDTVNYFEKIKQTMGSTSDFLRLFMSPGMGHCGGGIGPNQFDAVAAIDAWVTKGNAPDRLVASVGNRTRPLCPYPLVARYKGQGSIDEAANFACREP